MVDPGESASDVEPELLLSAPTLAPLASLGRGGESERARAYAQAVQIIQKDGGPFREQLQEWAAVVGTINVSRGTVQAITAAAALTELPGCPPA